MHKINVAINDMRIDGSYTFVTNDIGHYSIIFEACILARPLQPNFEVIPHHDSACIISMSKEVTIQGILWVRAWGKSWSKVRYKKKLQWKVRLAPVGFAHFTFAGKQMFWLENYRIIIIYQSILHQLNTLTILTLIARSLSPAFASMFRSRWPRFRSLTAFVAC